MKNPGITAGKNYETWTTYSQLSSNEATYRACLEIARLESSPYKVAQAIREYVSNANPLADSASLYADLLNGALGSVDWAEIAEAFEPDSDEDGHDHLLRREDTDWDAPASLDEQPETQFSLGRTVATPAALAACERAQIEPAALFARHHAGDWGDLESEDLMANEKALKDGGRLLSAYLLSTEQKIWVITEADRSVTTLLLPGRLLILGFFSVSAVISLCRIAHCGLQVVIVAKRPFRDLNLLARVRRSFNLDFGSEYFHLEFCNDLAESRGF